MAETDKRVLWPGWETVRLIGRGSFGAVYEIERDVFGHKEKAAMKLISIPQSDSDIEELRNDGYDESSITARFASYLQDIMREYSLMADMKGCANIVYCDDVKYVQHDNGIGWDIFIKMELLTPLPRAIGSSVTDEQVVRIGSDICSALVFCEKRHILHRDIKPQNIFVASDGTCKLGDFGIAKTAERTTSGTKTGTYKYMAPEVYNNLPYGTKADVYSLGLVLYWLLNERRTPFLPLPPATPTSGDEDKARARRFSGEPIGAPSHGSPELQRIVLKACAFDPKERYQSAEEMLRDLDALRRPVSSKADASGEASVVDADTTVGVWEEREPRRQKAPQAGDAADEKQETVRSEASYSRHRPQDGGNKAFCSRCGAPLEFGTKYCVNCGASQSDGGRQKKPAMIGTIAAVTVIVIALVVWLGGKDAPSGGTTPTAAAVTTSAPVRTPAAAAPSPTPAPTPAPEPTPVPTPEPTPEINYYQIAVSKCRAYESVVGGTIELPLESEILSEPITYYVKGKNENGGIYLCRTGGGTDAIVLPGQTQAYVVRNHTPVTIYAIRGTLTKGHAFAETSDGKIGWMRTDRLWATNDFTY